jgi:hypothetical protein
MTTERPRIAEDLDVNEAEDGLIIYQESTERVHHLNPTASIVFQLCDGSRNAAEIGAIVGQLFGLDHAPDDEVEACFSGLIREGLAE